MTTKRLRLLLKLPLSSFKQNDQTYKVIFKDIRFGPN